MTNPNALPHLIVRDSRTEDGTFNTTYFTFVPLEDARFFPTALNEVPDFTLVVIDRQFKTFKMAFDIILKKDANLRGVLVDRMVKGAVEEFFAFLHGFGLTVEELAAGKTGSERRPSRKDYLSDLLRSLVYPNSDHKSLFRTLDSKVPFRLYLCHGVWIESRRVATLHSRSSEHEGRNTLKGWIDFPNADVLYFLNGDSFISFKGLAENQTLATYIESQFYETWPFDSRVQFGPIYTHEDVGLSLLELAHKYEYLPVKN